MKNLFKRLLAAIIIIFLIYLVDTRSLISSLSNITLEALILLILISFLLIYVSAVKWQIFIKKITNQKISVLHLFNLYLVGYFINSIVPSYIGGDAVRSWKIGGKVGHHEAAASTILERYTGLVAMVTLATIFVWFVDVANIWIKLVVVLMALGLVIITILALSLKLLHWFSKYDSLRKVCQHLSRVQEAFLLVKNNTPIIVETLVLSFLFHSVTVINVLVAGHAVGWDSASMLNIFVVLPLILLIGALPITPSGLGIQEGAYLVFLKSIGATESQALAVAIILRAKGYILGILGGIILLVISKWKPQTSKTNFSN